MASPDKTLEQGGASDVLQVEEFLNDLFTKRQIYLPEDDTDIIRAVAEVLLGYPNQKDEILRGVRGKFYVPPSASDQVGRAILTGCIVFLEKVLSCVLEAKAAEKKPEKIRDETGAAAAGAASLPTG